MHGIVLLEGLSSGKLPKELEYLVEREYEHFLGGSHGTVNICRLQLDEALAPTVAFALSRALRPSRYYARLNNASTMYVAYPTCVVRIAKSRPESAEVARAIGALYEIERSHMRYEEMFELDHPEMHDVSTPADGAEAHGR